MVYAAYKSLLVTSTGYSFKLDFPLTTGPYPVVDTTTRPRTYIDEIFSKTRLFGVTE